MPVLLICCLSTGPANSIVCCLCLKMWFSSVLNPPLIAAWRLQVPDLWIDVLHKIRALGFNTVSLFHHPSAHWTNTNPPNTIPIGQISIYTHWGLMQPSKDVWDLDGFRSYQPFFDLCMKLGLWVIARPGPYINAEVNFNLSLHTLRRADIHHHSGQCRWYTRLGNSSECADASQ